MLFRCCCEPGQPPALAPPREVLSLLETMSELHEPRAGKRCGLWGLGRAQRPPIHPAPQRPGSVVSEHGGE